MIKSLTLLTPSQHEQLALAIQWIAAVATPLTICCYAYRTRAMKSWCCIEKMPPAIGKGDQFHLLLVLREYDQRNLLMLEEQLQETCFLPMLFTYKLLTADIRAQLYLSGDRFTVDVYNNGVVLYDKDMPSRASIHRSLSELANGIIFDWEATYSMSYQCILTATRSARKYQYIPAVLMLYKAAVLLTKGVIYARKGKMHPSIALSSLLNSCEMCFLPAVVLFPRATPDAQKLLARFEYVGTNGRPHPSGPADKVMVQTLTNHVEKLYELAPGLLKTTQYVSQ